MTKRETELLKERRELIQEFGRAFRGGSDGHAQLEGLRQELSQVESELQTMERN